MAKHWFISHPSAGPDTTPTFFRALDEFVAENRHVRLVIPEIGSHLHMTKKDIEQSDLVVGEVSIPSTGSGIELGWAHAAGKTIIAFHQGTTVISPAIQFVATAIHIYLTDQDILKVLKTLT